MTRAPSNTSKKPSFQNIQDLIWPEQGICLEYDLYAHFSGPAAFNDLEDTVHFTPSGTISFNTYFNLFNIGKWKKHCALEDLHLAIFGTGELEIRIFLARPGKSSERLVNRPITLSASSPARIDLSAFIGFSGDGVLYFELRALSASLLSRAQWQTRQVPRRIPDIALSITTFKREAAVRKSVMRFEEFIKDSSLKDHFHLIVVDNGQTAEIKASSHVTPVRNPNFGGSGGFARGLLEARDREASYCVFMDDDAALHMKSYERTWAFLAYATDSKTAVAGALTMAENKWCLWENGALFDRYCMPQSIFTDLRNEHQVFNLEYTSTADVPHNFYGGWWYFAFPIEHVSHFPFPFFVRGDDISFGLVHDFNTVTLNGVVVFQDQDFSSKESLQTLYLDMRNHIVHHLSLSSMDIGRARTLGIAIWFFRRSLVTCHYETLAALNSSFEDVMHGPDFFDENADHADRRATLGKLRNAEDWKPAPETLPPRRMWLNPDNYLTRTLMVLTLNGHLLPFFKSYGNRVVLPRSARGNIHLTWGAAKTTFIDESSGTAYTVTHSKWRALHELRKFCALSWAFWRDYDVIKKNWQSGYRSLTTAEFWERKIKRSA